MSKGMFRVTGTVLCSLLSLLLLVVTFTASTAPAGAQGPDDAAKLAGRLGGSLADARARFGEPSWTDVNLIGYNSVLLNGVDTIVVVYYDAGEIVNKISLVYLEKPATFADPAAISGVVAQVAPQDGACGTTKLATSGLGIEVYGCESKALATAISPSALTAAGLKGAPGSYNFSVDPTADEYYEIIVQPGTDTDVPPVPTAAPEPTAAPTLADQYPPVVDVRELAIGRGFSEGDKLSVSGTVQTIFVEGDLAQIQIAVGAPDGTLEWVIVFFQGDSSGVFEGSWITVYGIYSGTECFTNALGGEVCQPLIVSDRMDR